MGILLGNLRDFVNENWNFIVFDLCLILFFMSLPAIRRFSPARFLNPSDLHVRKDFMTKRERVFHKKLLDLLDADTQVMCQVRLVDIIQINPRLRANQKKFLSLFRRVSQWHCDFVLLDESYNVKCVIELDDKSHSRADRIKRDDYFSMVLEQSGIPLLRFPNIQDLTTDSLKNYVIKRIKK